MECANIKIYILICGSHIIIYFQKYFNKSSWQQIMIKDKQLEWLACDSIQRVHLQAKGSIWPQTVDLKLCLFTPIMSLIATFWYGMPLQCATSKRANGVALGEFLSC